jgi:non-canonical purine NTP pyrophosphatase (RdgB/HAM1 family)
MIYFITGNKNKFEEVRDMLPVEIEQLVIDLPEVQEIDSRKIVKAKIAQARKHQDSELMVEDTALHLEALNGLPGPFIKWFEETVTNAGLATIAEKMGNTNAEAKVTIGYSREGDAVEYYEGSVMGDIVHPRGESGFGWDIIFQPKGETRTFAEMSREEKNKISHRTLAVQKLAEALA